uniref:phosphatidate phosphatase n=1 Tax=Cyprinus carpio TaxID=7962 RepID=A0A8C1UIE0_CYPCA
MNYVGQLAETVYVTVKELYRGLNPATLTGGIDVIVVRQPDGSYQCSPFHVRFGKLGVLRSKEKVVDIEVNGEPVSLHMKLGDNGEAFFVKENEDFEVCLADCEFSSVSCDVTESPSSITSSSSRRKKRRRKRARSDTHLREEASSSSDEKESLDQDFLKEESPLAASKSVYYSLTEEPYEEPSGAQSRDVHPHSDGECSVNESVFFSRPSSPKSDSELCKPQESLGPQMQWNWGAFPKVCQAERDESDSLRDPPIMPSDHSHFRTILRQASIDLESTDSTATVTVVRPEPQIGRTSPVSSSFNTQLDGKVTETHLVTFQSTDDSLTFSSTDKHTQMCNITRSTNTMHGTSAVSSAAGSDAVAHAGSQETWDENNVSFTSEIQNITFGETESNTRSHHLGPSDIYLDDLSTLDPEAAALYFPKRLEALLANMLNPSCSMNIFCKFPTMISLAFPFFFSCVAEKFMEHLVKYQDFVSNPGIIEDPNLVICINSKYYNWAVAAPMILSVQAFQKTLPKSTIEQLVKDKMPKKSGRWWFSWRRKDRNNAAVKTQSNSTEIISVELSSDEDVSVRKNSEGMNTAQCISQMYRKSLRLTSEQIESLNLREGANTVVFSVTTQYQGTCRCEAAIYLWSYDDKIIISDIDGTITKSDALGHILPQLGKDWTHHGIAKLYHKIHQNGYKFLYCSARAIGMADITKGYLQWVNDRGTVLPKGPVLLAPSSLFSALHREVIEKKPEVFKIACLTDIRDLFSPVTQPFYAAFGNRTNDAYAYKEVGVPETHIFTVNPRGELIQEKTKGNKSSYSHLSELVDHVFPFLCKDPASSFDCPEFSHFSFWREPLPPLDLADLI